MNLSNLFINLFIYIFDYLCIHLFIHSFILSYLSDPTAASSLFSILFATFPVMEADSTQRLIVLSLSSLLSLPSNSLPIEAKNNIQNMFQQIIRELVFIEEQKEKDDNAVDNGDDDDDGDDDDGETKYFLFKLLF